MTRPPLAPLLLTLGGLIPFVMGAVIAAGWLNADMGDPDTGGYPLIGARDGALILTRYGVIILCFMSGVLWGFATKASGAQATACYVLSVIPALWAFLNPGTRADEALINLMIGFAGVLILDFAFARWGLAPKWWMTLRVPVTGVVISCLAIGAFA